MFVIFYSALQLIGNITYAFWSDSGKIDAKFFESPDDQSVKDYLNLVNQPNTPINAEATCPVSASTLSR